MTSPSFDRPFPAVTPAQRYHLDVLGYVVVQNTLSSDEVEKIAAALYRLRGELAQLQDPTAAGPRVRGSYFLRDKPHHSFMAHIVEVDCSVTAYATHPRLVSMAEELIGGEARIVEMNAHINSRDPEEDLNLPPTYGFHRGTDIPFGTHTQNGLFHCNFVKTLTNLTDLGPDDGGTVVVAGSHKIDAPTEAIVAAAYEDRQLIHQVVAPAGSTLLFSETLIHATGQIRSDRERVIIITGYGSTLFPYWDNGILSADFKEQIPAQLQALFHGRETWTRGPRYRALGDPVDERSFRLDQWADRPLPKTEISKP
jgi:ectoine hydroxylase-related dioxygenase (phytanoyl-CoA dioxygenase family)